MIAIANTYENRVVSRADEFLTAIRERRFRYVYIGEIELLGMFFSKPPQFYRIVNRDIPVDAFVTHGFHDHDRSSVCLVLAHPSFDPVPCGSRPPIIDGETEFVSRLGTTQFSDGEGI